VTSHGDPGRAPEGLPGSGLGLLGLRERVELYGGTLTAGPVDGTGWRLAVSLPARFPADETVDA
jgi:signal transduction histidine kinase